MKEKAVVTFIPKAIAKGKGDIDVEIAVHVVVGSCQGVAVCAVGVQHPAGSEELYKLTGWFAMVNQVVGRARRTPKEEEQNESLLRNYIRLAIMAG